MEQRRNRLNKKVGQLATYLCFSRVTTATIHYHLSPVPILELVSINGQGGHWTFVEDVFHTCTTIIIIISLLLETVVEVKDVLANFQAKAITFRVPLEILCIWSKM